jgi:hypothetical protein
MIFLSTPPCYSTFRSTIKKINTLLYGRETGGGTQVADKMILDRRKLNATLVKAKIIFIESKKRKNTGFGWRRQ